MPRRWLRIDPAGIRVRTPRGEDAVAVLWLATLGLVGIYGVADFWNQLRTAVEQEQAAPEAASPLRDASPQLVMGSRAQPPSHSIQLSPSPADWVLAAIGLMAAIVALMTLRAIRAQARAAVVAIRISREAAGAAKTSADAVMLAERAYVDISHTPPGLHVNEDGASVWLEISVRNHGRTPARVTAAYLRPYAGSLPLPDVPPYTASGDALAFLLMPNENVIYTMPFLLSPEQREHLLGGNPFWILGYVDYIDGFRRRHRGGYARRYRPDPPSNNNLVFETQAGYNYDREREPGEGSDWEEPHPPQL